MNGIGKQKMGLLGRLVIFVRRLEKRATPSYKLALLHGILRMEDPFE
jgi:hypothetical protein